MPDLLLPAWSAIPKPIIGMLHLPPLPGSPRFSGSIQAVREFVLRDAEALSAGGVHGLLLENFGDAPFSRGRVPAYVVAEMTRIACELRRRFEPPLGINVLRNDGRSALAIALAAGAEFIRVNILCGARVTDQGILQGIAYALLRDRRQLDAAHIRILADVNVKHSAPLGPARPREDEVADTLERGGADALVVTGGATGRVAELDELRRVKAAAGDKPVLVGSGVTPDNIATYAPYSDGFVIGTSLKHGGVVSAPVDADRVRALAARAAS